MSSSTIHTASGLRTVGLDSTPTEQPTVFSADLQAKARRPLSEAQPWGQVRGVLAVATATQLGLLTLTGILLGLFYAPGEQAYASIVSLEQTVRFGSFVRAIHYFSAGGALVAAFGWVALALGTRLPYRVPKWIWWSSLAVVGLIVTQALTGYLLRADQVGYWGTVVAISISDSMFDGLRALHLDLFADTGERARAAVLGSSGVTAETVRRFDRWHVAIAPLLLIAGIALLYRSRSNTFPKPLLFVAIAVAATLPIALAGGFDAPLAGPGDPRFSENPSKPLWYFRGLQELVYDSTFWGGVVYPKLLLAALILAPFFASSRVQSRSTRWYVTRALVFTVAWTVAAIVLGEIQRQGSLNWTGLGPTSLLIVGHLGLFAWAARRESKQLGLILFATSQIATIAVLTYFVSFHRGPDWKFFATPKGWEQPSEITRREEASP